MSTGADAKTMPGTAEFREGYERVFGDRKPQRGRWVWDKAQGKLVPADEYVPPPEEARAAPIMVDRFMEGAQAQDGTDIGSRRKRREYLQREGLTDANDYSPGYAEKVRRKQDEAVSKSVRETVGRVVYERWKP